MFVFSKKNSLLFRFFLIFILGFFFFCLNLLPFSFNSNNSLHAAQKRIYCAVCGKRITSRYLQYKGHFYCSQKCLDKVIPKCVICGRPAKMKASDGKYYCSDECYKKSLPICAFCHKHIKKGVRRGWEKVLLCSECAALPRCFACSMPADYAKLSDGRYICRKCRSSAITDLKSAIKLAESVRNVMRSKLGLSTNHKIEYKLVSYDVLNGKAEYSNNKGMEFGLFHCDQKTTTRKVQKTVGGVVLSEKVSKKISYKYTIYFLSYIPKDKFIEVAAHELAHDWMQENYPNIQDLKVIEGWAEFTASLVNKIYGHGRMNMRMVENRNKIYGDGYRMIHQYAVKHKISGLLKMFAEKNKKTIP